MTKESEYRENAAETLALAGRVGTLSERRHLLALAEKWLDLADRAHTFTSRFRGKRQPDHPAVAAKFGISSAHD